MTVYTIDGTPQPVTYAINDLLSNITLIKNWNYKKYHLFGDSRLFRLLIIYKLPSRLQSTGSVEMVLTGNINIDTLCPPNTGLAIFHIYMDVCQFIDRPIVSTGSEEDGIHYLVERVYVSPTITRIQNIQCIYNINSGVIPFKRL